MSKEKYIEFADLLSDEAIGSILGKQLGLDRALTPSEVKAYAKVPRKLEEEDEVNHAIALLEDKGYTVLMPGVVYSLGD